MIKMTIGVVIALVGFVGAMVFGSQPRENYTISPRSDVPVIEVSGGAPNPVRGITSIYGDDRFVVETKHAYETSRSKDSVKSRSLTHEQTRELVDIAIDGGLIGMSWADLEKRIKEETGGKPITLQHPGSLRIRYRLDAFGATGDPVDFTFECRCSPGVLKFHHENVPEIIALFELMTKINEYAEGVE